MRYIKVKVSPGELGFICKMITEYEGKIEIGSSLYLCDDGTVTPVNRNIVVGNYNVSSVEEDKTEQPLASELTKEAIELDEMFVSEIVAKYESSWNAIAVLKRKFRQACESDEWMESATQFYENGGCPICFSTDEAGCKEGCYLGQLQDIKEQSPASEYPDSEFIKVQRKAAQLAADAYEEDQEWYPTKISRLLDACRRLDASTTSQKDLLVACKIGLNGLKAVLQIAVEFEAKGEVFLEESKSKHKNEIEIVEAAIVKAQPKKVENKDNE